MIEDMNKELVCFITWERHVELAVKSTDTEVHARNAQRLALSFVYGHGIT